MENPNKMSQKFPYKIDSTTTDEELANFYASEKDIVEYDGSSHGKIIGKEKQPRIKEALSVLVNGFLIAVDADDTGQGQCFQREWWTENFAPLGMKGDSAFMRRITYEFGGTLSEELQNLVAWMRGEKDLDKSELIELAKKIKTQI